ncbi:zinc finger BED domain-containing protein RICESLEEPER 2-like [Rhizophagus irregularis DAOM 181602=DAOM 197198]|nr:zinc finger BED domain-containing protein RICESLEEPER 2-like [Rhizophagus irregularis DAOM 181602=DAOM 197198]
MITDDEWDLIADLTEVLSTFADATEDLGGSKYVTNSMRTLMLMEIIKTVTTDLANNQDSDEEEDDAFENNDAEEGQDSTQNSKINEPINTFGLLDKVKSKLYKNIKKYYPTLFTESLIPSILDPRFKKLDFAPEAQKIETKRHLQELFNNEKMNYQNNQAASSTQSTTQSKSSKKRKTLMARLSKANVVVINEIEEYLQLPEIALDSNPLMWWREKKESFPILSGFAQKHLAVSATSTAIEPVWTRFRNWIENSLKFLIQFWILLLDRSSLPIINPVESDIENTGEIDKFVIKEFPRFTADLFREFIFKWVICDDQPFVVVECDQLRKLFCLLNPNAKVPSADTVRNDIMNAFKEERNKIRDTLQNTPGCLSFTLDAWTSPSCIPFLGITVHWISQDWKLKELLLDFVKLSGPHSGENLYESFVRCVCDDMKILTKIIACTTDNATNNDTLMSALETTCQEKGINFTAYNNHIRCMAHIINLAAQDALSSLKVGYVESEDEILNQNKEIVDVIPKLRKLVVKILASSQR